MLGHRLKRARQAKGRSQRQIASRANLSAMAISKLERGLIHPTSRTLIALARALAVPVDYLLDPGEHSIGKPEYPKRTRSLPKKLQAMLEADVLDQAERYLNVLALFPEPPVPRFEVPPAVPDTIASMEQVEWASEALRDAWRTGRHAIPNLTDLMEDRGILVITTPLDDDERFDGVSMRIDGLVVIVAGEAWSGERQRFTLARELGRTVLSDRLAMELDERAAIDRFARALLVSRETGRLALGVRRSQLAPRELYHLKHEFGMSMSSWVRRAEELDVISEASARKLRRSFSQRSWIKHEPGQSIPAERPRLFEQLVFRAAVEDVVSSGRAAELLRIPRAEFQSRSMMEPRDAASGE